MHRGYIKIFRKIIDSWIFGNPDYFKAFFVILSEVNHKPKTILIKSKLINCERGESVNCLDTWASKFGKGWDKSRVRRFFKLLEKDSMIIIKNETITTHLSVCNYETYQGEQNDNETQVKHKRNASETQVTLNKNDKNDKKYIIDYSLIENLNVESWLKWIK